MSKSATDQKILWVDDDPLILAAAQRLARHSPYQLIAIESPEEGKSRLQSELFSVILCDQRMPGMTGIELLSYARQHSPVTTRIMITAFLDEGLIEDAINRAAVFRFMTKPWSDSELLLDLQAAVDHHQLSLTQQTLLQEVKVQNRRLEELTGGLEQIVNERTRSIELSKVEAEEKSARIRALVRFVTELSGVASIEDLLELLRKDLRRFHQVGQPILAFFAADMKPSILTFRSSQIIQKEPSSIWSGSLRVRVSELADQQYLANQFGRPFQRVIAVPLRRRWHQDESEPEISPTIFLEHSLNENEIEPFLEFLSERLQPLSIALDRILVESQMRFASLQWESTFDGIEDPIAIIDTDYVLTRANRSFGPSQAPNQPCYAVFAGRDSVCPGCPVERATQEKVPQVSYVKRGDRFYSVYSYPIKIKDEALSTNLINHYVDITDSRKLYGQMIQNEKMAAIGLMAGNIAHELNNPLTGIRSLAQILLSENPQGPVHDDLLEVEKAAARSEAIIRNLLEFSRGDIDREWVVASLNAIVVKTLPMLKTALRQHRSELNLSPDQLLIKAEPQLLQQIVFNLVNNACQAMSEPGEVQVETRRVSHQAKLLVRDTGVGISPELMERIFDPFFTTKSEGQGTGLGLSMCRSIVEQFGGTIEVQSEPGKGSEFCITLPLAEETS